MSRLLTRKRSFFLGNFAAVMQWQNTLSLSGICREERLALLLCISGNKSFIQTFCFVPAGARAENSTFDAVNSVVKLINFE